MPWRKLTAALATATVIAAVTLFAAGRQGSSNLINEHPRYKKWPITDFDKPEPSDPEARKSRKSKGDRFTLKDKSVDPRRFAITEDRESTFGSPEIHSPPEPAFPVAKSNVIVIAEVISAEAFLSSDRVSIYSEFGLAVREVIHSDSAQVVAVGTLLKALRAGGGVRFPSGKVILQGNDGKPLPDFGSTYAFFLNEYDSEGYFEIVTAYEIRAGKVFPLDGRSPRGRVFSQYLDHQKLTGTDETAFLYFVRQALQGAAAANPREVN